MMTGNDEIVYNVMEDTTLNDLFADMKFITQDFPEVTNDIHKGSFTMIGNGSDIDKCCNGQKTIISSRAISHRICHINNAN